MTPERYDDLVHGLYLAATGERAWHEVLQGVCDGFASLFCQLVALDRRSGRLALSLHSTESPMDGVLDYVREFHRFDPHVAHAATLAPGQVFNTAGLISAHEASIHPFYQQFWAVHGVRYMSGGKVSEDPDLVVYMGLFRSQAQGPLPPEEDDWLRRLFGHLEEAFAAYRRYTRWMAEADSGRALIDQSARPMVLIGPDRSVLHANAAAHALLEDGEVIVSRSGYLGCREPASEEALARALHGLALEGLGPPSDTAQPSSDRKALALLRRDGTAMPACLWALRPQQTLAAFGEQPRAMLILTADLSDIAPDPVMLAAGFGLTPAEGRILAGLAQVNDIRQVAQALGISFHTARAHLRSIFQKTGLDSQKELLHQARSVSEWR